MRVFRRAVLAACVAAALCGCGCSSAPSYAVRTHRMGDRIELGNLVYNVYDSQWHTQLGEGPGARVPESRFFLVRVSITNSGPSDIIVPNLSISDESGKTIQELSNGDRVPQWIGYLRGVKPAETIQGYVVFDCAPRNYKVRLTDESEQKVALVDIPLTFGSETPEVPTPELPEKK